MPTRQLDSSAPKLYLSGAKSVSKAYPFLSKELKQVPKKFLKRKHTRLCIWDSQGEYLYSQSANHKRANVFDLKSRKVYIYSVKDAKRKNKYSFAITSSEKRQFYAVFQKGGHLEAISKGLCRK